MSGGVACAEAAGKTGRITKEESSGEKEEERLEDSLEEKLKKVIGIKAVP